MNNNYFLYIKEFGLKIFLIKVVCNIVNKLKITKIMIFFNKIKRKKILDYLEKKYNYYIENFKNTNYLTLKNYNNNKIVWIFWWQGIENAPDIVKKCILNNQQILSSYEVNVVTENNISTYISVPDYILKKVENGDITLTTFSDYVRMKLLKEYGGFWMDATIYLTDNPFKEKKINDFFTIKFHEDNDLLVANGKWCGFFIGGDNYYFYTFMVGFFEEYFKNEKLLIDYFLIDYIILLSYNHIKNIREKFDSIPYNNEKLFELQNLLNNKFIKDIINDICVVNDVHKLSYKNPINYNDSENVYNCFINKGVDNENK